MDRRSARDDEPDHLRKTIMPKRKLILDVDTGTDDAVAIMCAALHPELELVACTTVNGNVEVQYCTNNTLRALGAAGRGDIPVYEGVDRPLARADFPVPRADMFQNGVHGRELPIPDTDLKKRDGSAIDFLIDTYRNTTDEIVLMPVGPLSNIATVLAVYPQLVDKVPEVIIMGGAHHKGNVTPQAEFNIWGDPEAAAKVFRAGFRKVTMIPLDATHKALVSAERAGRLRALGTTAGAAAAAFIEQRIRAYDDNQPMEERNAAPVHDALCVNFMVDPTVVDTLHRHVDVECHGTLTVGRTVVDTHYRNRKDPNCHVAFGADREKFCDFLESTLALGPKAG
jgi:inosine-uridine nucleoside N-ribohydrolase